MATTVSHPLPFAQAQAIADLTGYEDAATLRWQQACVQAANTLTALPNGRYVNVRVAYLGAADNVSRLLPRPLSDVNQLVIRFRNPFSRPPLAPLACLCTHLSRSISCASPGTVA
jgi:hypothetical protein